MEITSTPQRAVLPRAANLVTVAALVAATWWSGTQRNADLAAATPQATPAPATAAVDAAPALPARPAPELATAQSTRRTLPAATRFHDGVQTVGFQTAVPR